MAMDAVLGREKILMFRRLEDAASETAVKLALQTSHEITESRDVEVTQTKDGAIVTNGGLETTISIEAVASRDEVNTMLRDAVRDGDLLEVWEVDLGSTNETGQYAAQYGQGYLSEWTTPSDVEETTTISTEMSVNGRMVAGYVTLTPDQEAEILYAFRDITPVTGA